MTNFERVPFDRFQITTPCRMPVVGPTREHSLLANTIISWFVEENL